MAGAVLLMRSEDMPAPFFNALPDLHTYTAQQTHELAVPARDALRVFEKYAAADYLGVGLNHIHYPVEEGHCVVMRATGTEAAPLATDVRPNDASLLPHTASF